MLDGQQATCVYEGRHRELCPHIIGTDKSGEEAVLAWQFAGKSSGPLPQWRCLKLANVSGVRARDGRWHEGGSHRTTQTCVKNVGLDINVHVRKLR
ncbi:hypothetical protein IVA81_20685 [Bradyrhizobium sp. 141]|nr:hypothetical protein [Bradyrhizobium sp. 141]